MAGLNTGTPIVQVYHEKSRILPDVARVLACLYEKDINFERHTSSYKSLLKLQASTHAPVPFYDGPTFLEESREICRHIAEKYEGQGYPFLLGKDALERASVEEWLHIEEHAFNPPSRALFCYLAFPTDKYDNGDDTDMHIRKLEEVLDIYEQRLSDSEFLVGNKFTLADLVHLPNSHYITASKKYLKLYDSRKNVRRWWDAISIRASWQHVLMDMKSVEEQNKQVELKEEHQQQPPITDAPPTKGRTPDGHEPDDLEFAGSKGQMLHSMKAAPRDAATIHEGSRDATIDEKTATYDASDDQLATGSLHEQAQPPAPIHETTELVHGPTSKKPQLGGRSQAEAAHAEHKSTPSDKKTASDDSVQMIFPQQTRPSASIIRGVPTSDSQKVAWQIQEVTPDNHRTDDSAKPRVPSREDEISHSSQAIPRQEDMTYSPSARSSQKLDYQFHSGQVHEVTPYESSEKQGSHVGSAFGHDKLSRAEKKIAPSDQGLGQSAEQTAPRVTGEQGAQKTREVPNSEDALDISAHGDLQSTTRTKPPRKSFSLHGAEPTSSPQAPPLHVDHEFLHTGTTPDDALENVQLMKPSASPDAQRGITPRSTEDDITLAEHNFVPSGQDSGDILDKQCAVVPASAPAAQHGAATDKALDKQKIVPSGQDFVHPKQPSSSPEEKNGGIGDSAPLTQQISSTKPRKGDVTTAPDQVKDPQKQDILPPVRSISGSSDIQRPSGKVHDNVRADDSREAKPIVEAPAPDTQDDTASDEIGSGEKKIGPSRNEVLCEPTSSIEPRNEEIRDSAPLTHLASSTETMKENATIIAGPEEKDLQTTLDQPDILSMPIKLAHSLSHKAREDAPADDLREASSKPSAPVREVRPSTVVPASPPETQQGAARDETLDKQKFVPSGQDFVHSTLPRNGEIGEAAPSTQQIYPTKPRKGDIAASAPDQAKDTQITLGPQVILPPVTLVSSSADTKLPPGTVHKDLPAAADDSGEGKPIVQTSAPNTQEAKKFVPSGQISSAEPKNKEIRDSAPSKRLISSTGTRKEDSLIAVPDQDKDSQTTLDQQDKLSTPVRSASQSSDTQSTSEKAREDAPADSGDDASKSLALDRAVNRLNPPTVVPAPASSPATLQGSAPDETAHDGKKIEPSGQGSAQTLQPSFPSEPTKEDTIVMAADQTKDPQTIIHQQNITPTKTPLPVTKGASSKIQERSSDGIDTDESVLSEEQVSLGQRDSRRREGNATDPYGTTIDEKTATSPSSKTYTSESGSDLTRVRTDVHPSISEGPTAISFPKHGVQAQPPFATQSVSLDASSKVNSTSQEAEAPIAAASDTQPGPTPDTTSNQKVAPPLLSQKPTSHVLPPSEPFHDAAPHEELTGNKSIIEQWRRATAPLKDTSTDSDHNERNISSDIKEMPMSQEAPLNSQHVNQIAQQSGEQTVEPPKPIGTETSGVQHAAPSLPEAATTDRVIIDDKFVKQSIIDERPGEPKQTQELITDVRPASPPTKGKTPDSHEPGDLEFAGSGGQMLDSSKAAPPDPATVREDSRDATIDEDTVTYDASDDQLATGSLHEQAQPPAPIHETTELVHDRTSKKPQLGGRSQADAAHAEHKSSPSDKKTARAAEPLSPDEPVSTDSDDSTVQQLPEGKTQGGETEPPRSDSI